MNTQIERTPSTFATLTAVSQFGGFTLPSRHWLDSGFQRAQSRQYTKRVPFEGRFMLGLALWLSATFQAPMHLEFYQGTFVFQCGILAFPIPAAPVAPTPTTARYRRGDRYAVWDARGLTVRDGDWSFTTGLEEVPTSSKLFERKDILALLGRFERGERSKTVSALSGSTRIFNNAYFLARWSDTSGAPWLEALVRVDLSAAKPKPQLVGRFDGVTLADGTFDDRLFAVNDRPTAVVRKGTEWGLASCAPGGTEWTYKPLGSRLRAHATLDPTRLAYVEALDYGPSRFGILDMANGERNDLFEALGFPRLLDSGQPICVVSVGDGAQALRNFETGASIEIPRNAIARRTSLGILAWWPAEGPKHAVLIESRRMRPAVYWNSPKQPS